MYAPDRIHPQDPGLGQLDRGDDVDLDEAVISLLERSTRRLKRRQREMRQGNPALPEPGEFLPADDAA